MSKFNVLRNILNKFTGSIYKFNVLVQCGWSIWPTIYNLALWGPEFDGQFFYFNFFYTFNPKVSWGRAFIPPPHVNPRDLNYFCQSWISVFALQFLSHNPLFFPGWRSLPPHPSMLGMLALGPWDYQKKTLSVKKSNHPNFSLINLQSAWQSSVPTWSTFPGKLLIHQILNY